MTDTSPQTDPATAFQRLREASRAQPRTPWPERESRLDRLEQMIRDHRAPFARAIAEDFGGRPAEETAMAELFPALDGLRHARRHGRRWMQPQRVPAGRWLRPARAEIRPQPLGVVGIVAPWNYPLLLAAGPLTSAFVAGNRALLKPSELAPAFADAFAAAAADRFAADELAVVTGGAGVAEAVVGLPFDHLLFTGSTAVGRKVMAAAAANLTPVTLELGGKSPALIAPDVQGARLAHAAGRIMAGKLLNAGQTCLAPDYVLVPEDRAGPFLDAARAWVARHYPKLTANPDYTRIINDRHFQRLTAALAEAEAEGARLFPLSDAAPDPTARLLPPIAVTGAPPGSRLMREEIFGPVLPVLTYATLDQALAQVAARPRPLAFYPFTDDAARREHLLSAVVAGGVTVNDTLLHVAAHDLPFGGVGDSGMGAYHGRAGFERMSHMLPVLRQSRVNAAGLLAPPYGRRFRWLMRLMTR